MISKRLLVIIAALLALTALIPMVNAGGQAQQIVWYGEYYNNNNLSGTPTVTRADFDINFNWNFGSPATGLSTDNFSVRWTANVALSPGLYRFWAYADDQIRVTVDGRTVIDTFATNEVDILKTSEITLNTGQQRIVVEYREYNSQAFAYLDFANISIGETGPEFDVFAQPEQPVPTSQWVAQFYPNATLSNNPVAIINEAPTGNWGNGAPLANLPVDNWSARYQLTTTLTAGNYLFRATADDGVRVYVDNEIVINEWHTARDISYAAFKQLSAGTHVIVVEYFESGGTASLAFDFEATDSTFTPSTPRIMPEAPTPEPVVQPAPQSALGSVTIATGRLNVRDAPNPFTGQVLTRVTEGDRYQVLEFNPVETWVKINANGVTGWINAGYTTYNPPSALVDDSQYIVTASPYTVNIRTEPNTSGDIVATFEDGDTAVVVGRNAASTWWEIDYNGIVGWVSARYAIIEARATVDAIPITN